MATTANSLAQTLQSMSPAAQQEYLRQQYGNIGTPTRSAVDTRYGGEGEGTSYYSAGGVEGLDALSTGGYRGPLGAAFDQPGVGGRYGQYFGTFSPQGELQGLEFVPQQRSGSWLDEHGYVAPLLPMALAGGFAALGGASGGAGAGAAGAGAAGAGAGAAGAAGAGAAGGAAAGGAGGLGGLLSGLGAGGRGMDLFQLLQAAGTIYGAQQAGRSAREAAQTSAEATDRATDLQRRMYEESVARQAPWLEAGRNALGQLTAAAQYTPFGMQQFQADPGYAFRMQEGMRALERGAAARGGLLSGNTLRATQRYGQDLASQEYQNAFNRYQAERQARLGPLQSLAGVGQTTAQALGGAGQQYAANVGTLGMGQAQTAANAMLARGSAYQRGLGDLAYMTGRYYGGGGGQQAPAPIEARTYYMPPGGEDYRTDF